MPTVNKGSQPVTRQPDTTSTSQTARNQDKGTGPITIEAEVHPTLDQAPLSTPTESSAQPLHIASGDGATTHFEHAEIEEPGMEDSLESFAEEEWSAELPQEARDHLWTSGESPDTLHGSIQMPNTPLSLIHI